MAIDPHVHCRDGKQYYKETIDHALSVAERVGLSAIFDMPNVNPPVIYRDQVIRRLKKAEEAKSPVLYGFFIGTTGDPEQLKEAIITHNELFSTKIPKTNTMVVGLKKYAGQSVGNLGIINYEDQKTVFKTLNDWTYTGVLSEHCEKEDFVNSKFFNPKRPASHCKARPPAAEIAEVKNQINLATKYDFDGLLHITHISVPESIQLVDNAREHLNITCGITPHHLFLDDDLYYEKNGLWYKVNPPLRIEKYRKANLEALMEGKIDWIETDHAPHTKKDKLEKYMSGLPGLPIWPHIIRMLKELDMPKKEIENLTHNNIIKAFNIKIPNRKIKNPESDLFKEYTFNPYEHLIPTA